MLAPGFEGIGEGLAGGGFGGLAVADEVDGIDAVGLAEVGEVFAPVIAVGSKTVNEEYRGTVSACRLVADGEALPGPEVSSGGSLSHG